MLEGKSHQYKMTNTFKITLAITIPLVFIIGFLCLAWVYSPTEFTIIFQIENETLNVMNNFTEVLGEEHSFILNQTQLEEVLG